MKRAAMRKAHSPRFFEERLATRRIGAFADERFSHGFLDGMASIKFSVLASFCERQMWNSQNPRLRQGKSM
jgi:hypothetical protein